VPGALFSLGDAHAAQGDGEVCVTAIETGLRDITVRFDLQSQRDLQAPEFRCGVHAPVWDTTGWFATTGVETDLLTAARAAIRNMIGHLERERGLTREEAYMLCSVVVDLRINEIVNAGSYVVSAMLPDAIFTA
jgi:acetamidase/formamidase